MNADGRLAAASPCWTLQPGGQQCPSDSKPSIASQHSQQQQRIKRTT
jgi:hypothetical protein